MDNSSTLSVDRNGPLTTEGEGSIGWSLCAGIGMDAPITHDWSIDAVCL
jgi:hypothetical protein